MFVDGPAHGAAAKAIAQLLGVDPGTLPDDESWADFQGQLQSDPLAARLAADPILAGAVAELSKIAVEPEAQRLSVYSGGGGPGAIFGQAEKLFCHNLSADPGSIPRSPTARTSSSTPPRTVAAPLRNPHPLTQGNDDLCNPPGRGLGPRPTTETGYPLADAWLWTSPPGNSSGCGGGPPGGVFWPARAIQLAENANGQLGPGFASDAY